ncbi:MAG TPA: hypothetical protein VFK35_06610 [Candidatus Limnocylindrales bacterium]|nr:hypothetical protein [Candidatus Limnocylindrales bacterium]
MKALAYLLGIRALSVAGEQHPTGRGATEPALPPIASTPETAGAWRRWAEAGRTEAARAARKPYGIGLPAPSGGAA